MVSHKWSEIKNKMSPERKAKLAIAVKESKNMLSFHRFDTKCWQLRLWMLWITRHDDILSVWWSHTITIFHGIFWKHEHAFENDNGNLVMPVEPAEEEHIHCEWVWKPGEGLVRAPDNVSTDHIPDTPISIIEHELRNKLESKNARWKYVPGVGTVDAKTNEVFLPEKPIPLTEGEIEYGNSLAAKLKEESSNCGCSATYCSESKHLIHGLFKGTDKKDVPDPSDKLPEYQKQYWYPGTNIWETWRKYYKLTEEEAELRWGKKLR